MWRWRVPLKVGNLVSHLWCHKLKELTASIHHHKLPDVVSYGSGSTAKSWSDELIILVLMNILKRQKEMKLV